MHATVHSSQVSAGLFGGNLFEVNNGYLINLLKANTHANNAPNRGGGGDTDWKGDKS